MVINNSSRSSKRRLSAVTLAEFLIAFGIMMIVIAGVGSSLIYMGRSIDGMSNYIDLDRRSRHALDLMMSEVRQCYSLDSYATNRIVLISTNSAEVEFVHDADKQTLSRIYDGETNVLLTGCESLLFEIFRRNPTTNGDFTQYETASNPADCKVVQVNWVCKRKAHISTNRFNTESVQTAKIVLRNKL